MEDKIANGVGISGPGTYRNRDALKKLKFAWDKKSKCWIKDHPVSKTSVRSSLDAEGIEYREAKEVVESHLASRIVFLHFFDADEKEKKRKRSSSDDGGEAYWKHMCIYNNNFSWITWTDIWHWTWHRNFDKDAMTFIHDDIQTPAKSGIWIEDPKKRGFILVRDATGDAPKYDYDMEIFGALVEKEHRRKGVLKGMFEEVCKKFPNKKFWLICLYPCTMIWEKLGFREEVFTHKKGHSEMVYDGRISKH